MEGAVSKVYEATRDAITPILESHQLSDITLTLDATGVNGHIQLVVLSIIGLARLKQ